MTKYNEYKGLNMPSIEQDYLAKWKAEHCFEQSVKLRDGPVNSPARPHFAPMEDELLVDRR